MITISECGSFPDDDNLIKDAAGWSWMMVWNGAFVRDAKYNSLDLWKKFLASDYVITLDEMPNIRTYTTTGMINDQKDDLQIYPTYFDEQITIHSKESNQTISIFNQVGICMSTFRSENITSVISTIGYPAGMYLVKADENVAVKVFKR
jgi:mannan endo-1,4-beta-mannosidase